MGALNTAAVRTLFAAIALAALMLHDVAMASMELPSSAGLGPRDRVELDRLRESLRHVPPAQVDSLGHALAVFALDHMPPQDTRTPRDLKDAESALREACSRLPARTLAAIGAAGSHPIVSETYCRALLREKSSADDTIQPEMEASAEAADALHRFGAAEGKALLEFARSPGSPTMGAGGVTRSVYGIVAFASQTTDTGTAGGAVVNGLLAGVKAGAGTWANRFRTRVVLVDPSELDAAREVNLALDGARAGVMVVTGGANLHAAASARALGQGLVLVDARSPAECDPTETGEYARGWDTGLGFEKTRDRGEPFPLPLYSSELGYSMSFESVHRQGGALPLFQMRPPGTERGRRLAEVLRARPDVRRVAIALPEDGGDRPLVAGFVVAVRALGRDVTVLEYAPGRRDYAAEATRFAESGAQAILLAGPGEESGEWLTSLGVRKLKPLVLGTSELDPEGFHPTSRARIDGAVFVGDDWVDRPGELERRFSTMDPGPDRISDGQGADYRRGYRTGWLLARSILEGGFTPTRLARVLSRHSLKVATDVRLLFPVRTSGTSSLTKPEEVAVPLYTVKNGEAVPLPGF